MSVKFIERLADINVTHYNISEKAAFVHYNCPKYGTQLLLLIIIYIPEIQPI